MTTLSDKHKPGLPPPPAPPKRAANPWSFSETARKPEQRPDSTSTDLLAELMKKAPADDAHTKVQEPPQAVAAHARPGLMSLVVIGFAALIVMRLFFSARKDGDWVGLIGPLLVIAFIAHALWRLRQRREANKSKPV